MTCSDLLGCIRTRSEVFGSVRTFSEIFAFVLTFFALAPNTGGANDEMCVPHAKKLQNVLSEIRKQQPASPVITFNPGLSPQHNFGKALNFNKALIFNKEVNFSKRDF